MKSVIILKCLLVEFPPNTQNGEKDATDTMIFLSFFFILSFKITYFGYR